MKTKSISLAFATILFPCFLFAAPQGELVAHFIIQYPSISPNGDGVRDSSLVRVELTAPCSSLLLLIYDESGVPLDTLCERYEVGPGTIETFWNGKDRSGSLLPEGKHRLRLRATAGILVETYDRIVFLDLTAPIVAIERIEPGIYAPRVPGTADSLSIYFSIDRYGEGDTLSMIVRSPSKIASRQRIPISREGGYRSTWYAASSAEDGIYSVKMIVADEAGNGSCDSASFDLDSKAPTMKFLERPGNETNVPPTIITGSAYDRNGIVGMEISWCGGPSLFPDSIYTVSDTLFWRFDVPDSLSYRDGRYNLVARCSDIFGASPAHRSSIELTFDLDMTPPQPPVLTQPSSPVQEPSVLVKGTLGETSIRHVYLYRSASTDTTIRYEPLGTSFAVEMPLKPGPNTIRAAAEDRAGNLSELSSPVNVVYEPEDSISWPEVLRGPDVFRVYSERPALRVTIDIYSIDGEHIVSLSQNGPAQNFPIEWNLENADGEEVRNGVYLVTIMVKQESGTKIYKEFVAVVR